MKVLIPTDAFPPVCGGSGWSTYELARGLRARGHDVLVVQPIPGSPVGIRHVSYDGLRVIEFGTAAPNIPYLRNYVKNERLYPRLAEYLAELIADHRPDIPTPELESYVYMGRATTEDGSITIHLCKHRLTWLHLNLDDECRAYRFAGVADEDSTSSWYEPLDDVGAAIAHAQGTLP